MKFLLITIIKLGEYFFFLNQKSKSKAHEINNYVNATLF